jgi:hypothetical protein
MVNVGRKWKKEDEDPRAIPSTMHSSENTLRSTMALTEAFSEASYFRWHIYRFLPLNPLHEDLNS